MLPVSRNHNTNLAISVVVLLMVGAIIYLLSDFVVWTIDSVTYQYSFKDGEKIRSVSDIFDSMDAHYVSWNGRYFSHWVIQFITVFLGRRVFAVLNALVYVFLVISMVRYAGARISNFLSVLTAALLLLLLSDTEFLPNCQVGYLWGALFSTWYLIIFEKAEKEHYPWYAIALIFVFSVAVGNYHEALSIGIGGALVIYFLLNLRKVTLIQWVMAVGFGIGGLFLCLAPSVIHRASEVHIPLSVSILSLFGNLRVTYVFVAVLLYKVIFMHFSFKGFYKDNSLLINSVIVLFVFNLILGVGANRQLLGIEFFCGLLTLRLLKNNSFSLPWIVVGIICVVVLSVLKYREIVKAVKVYDQLTELIYQRTSDDIYVDFPSFSTFVHPTPCMRFGVYENYVLISILNDQAQTLNAPRPDIRAYPTHFRDIRDRAGVNEAYEYLPGEFMLVQDKESPANFRLHRVISLGFFDVPLPPLDITDVSSRLDTDTKNVLYIPRDVPFVHNKSIEVIMPDGE